MYTNALISLDKEHCAKRAFYICMWESIFKESKWGHTLPSQQLMPNRLGVFKNYHIQKKRKESETMFDTSFLGQGIKFAMGLHLELIDIVKPAKLIKTYCS